MSRAMKIVLGLASIWPLMYCMTLVNVRFPGWIFRGLWIAARAGDGRVDGFEAAVTLAVSVLLLPSTALMAIGLVVGFMRHAGRSDLAPTNRRMWRWLLVVGSVFTVPVYWYLHIWREPKRVDEGSR